MIQKCRTGTLDPWVVERVVIDCCSGVGQSVNIQPNARMEEADRWKPVANGQRAKKEPRAFLSQTYRQDEEGEKARVGPDEGDEFPVDGSGGQKARESGARAS